jgi:predicted dehydrogenase
LKILILGYGSIGKRHITNLKFLGYNDICVYDIDRELVASVGKNYDLPTVRSMCEGIDNKPDVAFICVPNHLHLSMAIPLAREGIHLFIEKPLDINLDNFSELSKIIVKNTIINMVGCNFRFDEGLKLIKNFLVEGQIGVPLTLRAVFGYYLPDWRPGSDYRKNYAAKKETGGGVILDRIHEFDYVLWLLGNVSSVSGFSRSTGSLDIETEDVADIILKHTNGVISNIHIDYLRREYLCC